MTKAEALTVAGIVIWADGGCSYCVADLIRGLQDKFPEHDWLALAGRAGFRDARERLGRLLPELIEG